MNSAFLLLGAPTLVCMANYRPALRGTSFFFNATLSTLKNGRDTFVSRPRGVVKPLQRAQEVQDVLLLTGGEVVVEVGLDRSCFSTAALVSFDSAE